MFVVVRHISECYGRKTIPDRYVTNENIIRDGEFEPVLDENLTKAQKFETSAEAECRKQEIMDRAQFYVNLDYHVEKV